MRKREVRGAHRQVKAESGTEESRGVGRGGRLRGVVSAGAQKCEKV